METLYRNELRKQPRVSVILVDWSVRESFHSLDYLNRQTVPRDQYELLWVEYYGARPDEITQRLEHSLDHSAHPCLDYWLRLGMPTTSYYHKHLLYNVGLLASRGEIITICDSDAIFTPTFIERTIEAFEREPELVLHMDEVRSQSHEFYPFNYPSIEQVLQSPCSNLVDGRPAGAPRADGTPVNDILHTGNYGACFSARRDDVIAIGGADEHLDYLGHVCGPYDMTFRLVNDGKKERWHDSEWLYHVWHPGSQGERNYVGPHDGRHMSMPALLARESGRILPLVENPGIRALRENQQRPFVFVPPLELGDGAGMVATWSQDRLAFYTANQQSPRQFAMQHPGLAFQFLRRTFRQYLSYWQLVSRTTGVSYEDLQQVREKGAIGEGVHSARSKLSKVRSRRRTLIDLYWAFIDVRKELVQRVRNALEGFASEGTEEIILFGAGEIAEYIGVLAPFYNIRASQVVDDLPGETSPDTLQVDGPPILIARRYGLKRARQRLLEQGVAPDRIRVLDSGWLRPEPEVSVRPAPRLRGTPQLSIVIPTRGRAEAVNTLLESIWSSAWNPEQIEVVLFFDSDDPVQSRIQHPLLHITRVVGNGLTMGEITETSFDASRGRYVMLFNDDVRIGCEGWDRRILDAFARFPDDIALVWGNDAHQRHHNATFPIVSRRVVKAMGWLTFSIFNHYHIESNIHDVFRLLKRKGHNRMVYLPDVVFEHNHVTGSARPQSARGRDDRNTFMDLFEERQRAAIRLKQAVESSQSLKREVRSARTRRTEVNAPLIRVSQSGGSNPDLTVVRVAEGEIDSNKPIDPSWMEGELIVEAWDVIGSEVERDHLLSQAIASARSEYVAIMASGMMGSAGWVTHVLNRFEQREKLAALWGSMTHQRNKRLVRAGGVLVEWEGEPRVLEVGRGLAKEEAQDIARQPMDGSGLFGLVLRRSAVMEVGGIASGFKGDLARGLDLCLRLRANAYDVQFDERLHWVLPEAEDSLGNEDPQHLADLHFVRSKLSKRFPKGWLVQKQVGGLYLLHPEQPQE